jgi:hypothetical protein
MERVLARLSRLNQTVVFLAMAVFVFVALMLPGAAGGVLLLALAGALGWLLARTWSIQPGVTRAARLVILALLVTVATLKLI